MMSTQSSTLNELNVIIAQLKSKSYSTQDLATKQLANYINKNRENCEEIVSKISHFFNMNNEIPDKVMIKVINNILRVLTENNTQIINFLNMFFPLLFHIVSHANRTIEYIVIL